MLTVLIVIVVLALLFDFVNGMNDAANFSCKAKSE